MASKSKEVFPSPWHWCSCTLNTVSNLRPSSLRQIWTNWSGPSEGLERRSGSGAHDLWKRWRELGLFSLAERRLGWSNSSLQLLEGQLQRWCSEALLGSGSWYHKGQWPQAAEIQLGHSALGNSHQALGKNSSPRAPRSCGTGTQRDDTSRSLEVFKTCVEKCMVDLIEFWQQPCFKQASNLQRSVPTNSPVILWCTSLCCASLKQHVHSTASASWATWRYTAVRTGGDVPPACSVTAFPL